MKVVPLRPENLTPVQQAFLRWQALPPEGCDCLMHRPENSAGGINVPCSREKAWREYVRIRDQTEVEELSRNS